EIVFFVGKNGVGKTTLMEIIVGLNEADSGEIFLDNKLIKIPYSAAVRRKIAYLPVDDQLIDYLTAGENLVYFAEIYKVAEYQKKIKRLLTEYLFEEHKEKLVKDYSTGMRRRLSLALMEMTDRPVMLFDEPSIGLDVYNTDFLRRKLNDYRAAGKTIIVTSHDLLLCQRLADRIFLFQENDIVESDLANVDIVERKVLDSYK
ncbi:multidrug ABC transporter ATPase, partial [Oenococcus alcoholitolerans]